MKNILRLITLIVGLLFHLSINAVSDWKIFNFNFNSGKEMQLIRDVCYFSTQGTTLHNALPHDSGFFDSKDPRVDGLANTYWMRFSVKNQESKTVSIQFFIGLSEELTLFVPTNKGFQRHSIGMFETRSKTKEIWGYGKTFMSQALIKFEPNETKTFYAHFNHLSKGQQAKRDTQIEARLIEANTWHKKVISSNFIWSFIFGCFVILFLYHFVFYFLTKDNTYLFYCLFVFAVSFPFLTLIIDIVDQPKYSALLFFSVSGLFSVFYFQLTRKLIDLNNLLPRWDNILKYSILIKIVLVAFYIIAYQIQQDIFIILTIYIPSIVIEFVLMIILAVALIKSKDKIALYFILGSSLAWLSMVIAILTADNFNSLTPQLSPLKFATPAIGFVLKSLVFAMVISYRVRLNEIEKKEVQDLLIKQLQENRDLQEKANLELEEKVIKRTNEIQIERKKTEELLLNVLPESVVEEMKNTGVTVPKKFENVSVIFSDFIGFTTISSNMTPEDLVKKLNCFFEGFDSIMRKYGLEKIKTIGDAYMAVCGLPNQFENHAERTVIAAFEMIDFMENYNLKKPEHLQWNVRIGVNSGDVVAGVIGKYKFAYDVWGDTVNIASRLESNSLANRVNISESTFQLIKHQFKCEERGLIKVKNNANLKMYFVNHKL